MSCKADKMDPKDMKVKLEIGGKNITMVPFVHNAFRDMIVAFVNNLSGHEGGRIEIVIDQ
jgi:hypothetical protein